MDSTLFERLRPSFSPGELVLIERAYALAERCHEGWYRHSGDPYITHSVEVATLAFEVTSDPALVGAALLHDTLIGTDLEAADLRAAVGDEVTDLVEAFTRFDQCREMPEDGRVLALKLCDRLHNMRTLRFLPEEKQRSKALDTLESLVPLADRLALPTVAAELETIARDRLRPGRAFHAVRVGALLLPPGARARYLHEWRAELATLPGGHRAYLAGLLLALPALAWVLWKPARRRPLLALFRTPLRPWLLISPVLLWLIWTTSRSGLAEAVMCILTVVPAASAAVTRVRIRLGLHDEDTPSG